MGTATYGEAVFKWEFYSDREPGDRIGIRCESADPRVRISPELVRQWHHFSDRRDWLSEVVQVTCAANCPIGDVITVNCVNRRLIYRITGLEPRWIEGKEPFAYLAEWPD